ncbi:ABC transporter substrate-binding protein [Pseudaminobacter soli (ex Li et al. 2025)]|uniref:Peptide ABC transporter substrate-binding protein n=1 Tax=Pseudaminobacter soli (ex Li et al. 2025) TaxID=1295366 RepID=A0A2P7SKC9_9HYPH|nr:ABC transporter substrate-binding protein [Mesorhizobium soli]PSJ62944.1 peptide ABC transporter substrate-binding protein [Mesorhizobium soli]
MNLLRATTGLALALSLYAGVSSVALAADLTIGVRSGPASIDPDFTATGTHAEAMKHIFDTLIKSGNDLQLEPGLAESWQALDDTTWEFKLRKGVKFHDGSDFTAEDVKFSIERIPHVTGANPTTVYVRRVKDIEIVDPYTVRVKTDGPAPTLPNDFIRLFIVSHVAAKDFSDTPEHATEGFNSGKAAIGTGPYKFVSWTPKEELVLERFDDYWGGKEPWDKVIRKELPNDAARVAQLKAGQVDIVARIPASDIATLENDSSLRIIKTDSVYEFLVYFDFREQAPQITANDGSPLAKNPFLDPRVREAFDLAIDRDTITEVAMEGMGKAQSQIITPNIFGYNPAIQLAQPDVEKAKQLLADAGYPDGFKVVFNFTNDRLPSDKEVGTTIAQMLAAINVTVEANAQPGAVYFPANTRGDYSFGMSGWGTLTGEANYALAALLHTNDPETKLGGFNVHHYSNPEMDKLIEGAAAEMDTPKREMLLQDANALVAKERPILPIASTVSAWGMKKELTITPRSDEDTLAMNIRPAN